MTPVLFAWRNSRSRTVLNEKVNSYLWSVDGTHRFCGRLDKCEPAHQLDRGPEQLSSRGANCRPGRVSVRSLVELHLSLIPWAGLSFFVLLFLSEITDQDRVREEEDAQVPREAYLREPSRKLDMESAARIKEGKARHVFYVDGGFWWDKRTAQSGYYIFQIGNI